jgi:hypothetical protein
MKRDDARMGPELNTPPLGRSDPAATTLALGQAGTDFQNLIPPSPDELRKASKFSQEWSSSARIEDLNKGVTEGKITPKQREEIARSTQRLAELNTIVQNSGKSPEERKNAFKEMDALYQSMHETCKNVEFRMVGPGGAI